MSQIRLKTLSQIKLQKMSKIKSETVTKETSDADDWARGGRSDDVMDRIKTQRCNFDDIDGGGYDGTVGVDVDIACT